MPESVFEAIQKGVWDYEPEDQLPDSHDATVALPGTDEKLEVLAVRIQQGLPLWHPEDRRFYDDAE